MDSGLDWYPHYPRDFLDGVQGLGRELIGALIVLLCLMYARGGSTIRDDRHLAGILGCSIRKAKALTDQHIARGKITQEGDQLTNKRVQKEAKSKRDLREAKSKAGQKGAGSRWRYQENNDLPMALPLACHLADKRRPEKIRSDENGGGGSPSGMENQFDWDEARHPAPEAQTAPRIPVEDLRRIREAAAPAIDPQSENWLDTALDGIAADWIERLPLGIDETARVVGQVSVKADEGSIKSPSYFTQALERAAERHRINREPPQSGGADGCGAVNREETFVRDILKSTKGSKDG